MPLPKPPAMRGLPLVGNLLEYRRDHVEVFRRGYEALGPIFTMRLGPQRAVVIVGPEYHRFFFTEVDKTLSMSEVYKFVIPMFGKILNAAETDERKDQLGILHHAFRSKKLQGYIGVMVQETLAWFDTLRDQGQFELWSSFEQLSMHIAATTLMGTEMRGRINEFLPLYHDLSNGMEFVLPPNLPLPKFRRRDRARLQLHAMMQPMIAERRRQPGKYNDFMQTLAEVHYPDGSAVPEDKIVGLALMTVFGAYETTTAQNCWTLIQLLQNPAYLETVRAEQAAVLGDDLSTIDLETLNRLDRLDWALKETERLRPVFSHYGRYNSVDYELGGYHIPKGWLTVICPSVSHRLPEIYSNPNVYDPERFSPERAEDRKYPYSLIGFGGGFYKCPGTRFGSYEMLTILTLLLHHFDLELVEPDPAPDFAIGIIRPKPPCMIRYRRRPVRLAFSSDVPAAVPASSAASCPYHPS